MAWFSGTEGQDGVVIVVSRLPSGSLQWEPPITVSARSGHSNQNPVLFVDPVSQVEAQIVLPFALLFSALARNMFYSMHPLLNVCIFCIRKRPIIMSGAVYNDSLNRVRYPKESERGKSDQPTTNDMKHWRCALHDLGIDECVVNRNKIYLQGVKRHIVLSLDTLPCR